MWQRLATVAAVAAVSVSVLPAAAATTAGTSVVGASACAASGGSVTRPAGTEIVVRQGWAAKTQGLVIDFLHAQTSTVSANGGTPADVSDLYGAPTGSAETGWRADVYYPTGIVLAPGESMTFRFVATVSHTISDGLTLAGPGTLMDFTCTVTGV
jgi:hypothetical protein